MDLKFLNRLALVGLGGLNGMRSVEVSHDTRTRSKWDESRIQSAAFERGLGGKTRGAYL